MMKTIYIIFIGLLITSCSTLNQSNPTQILSSAINDIRSANEIKIWSIKNQDFYPAITNATVKEQIADWISSQPLVYNEEESLMRQKGGVCGCHSVDIVISENHYISIHQHSLIIDNKTAFKFNNTDHWVDIHEVLIIAGIYKPPVQLEMDYCDAVVLTAFLDTSPVGRGEDQDSATEEVVFRLYKQLRKSIPHEDDMTQEEYDAYISNMKERSLGVTW